MAKIHYDRKKAAALLEDDDSFTYVLMVILIAEYDEELFTKDTAVLFKDIEDDFKCNLSEESENKINAALTVMTTDLFFNKPKVFDAVALAFNEGDLGGIPDGDDEELDEEEMVWAIFEVSLLTDTTYGECIADLSNAVRRHVKSCVGKKVLEPQVDDLGDVIETMPIHARYMEEKLRALGDQLLEIGADKRYIRELLEENGVEMKKDE